MAVKKLGPLTGAQFYKASKEANDAGKTLFQSGNEYYVADTAKEAGEFGEKLFKDREFIRASAVALANKKQVFDNIYVSEGNKNKFYVITGDPPEALEITKEEVDRLRRTRENKLKKAKEKAQPNETIKRYVENIQSFFINEIDQFSNYFSNKDPKTEINIHKLAGDVPAGVFSNIIARRGEPSTNASPIFGGFVHATPAQLAHLQPLLRFFMVDQAGNEEEIYFSDYTTGEYAKRIADLRSGGSINEFLSPRSQRGSDAGIKSFTWNYNNKHEGDYIIEAELQLYFGTLAELANINYLQFLFPTGAAADLAKDIDEKSKDARKKETAKGSKTKTQITDSALKKLRDKKTNYRKILSLGNQELGKISDGFKEVRAANKKEFRQLKVVVGWSIPKGNRQMLMDSFAEPEKYKTFVRGVEATSRAIFLNLYDYNVDFQQEGPTTLSLKYLGSSDNYLATPGSDILGSNNYTGNLKGILEKVTDTSIAGFRNLEGKVIDTRADGQESSEVERSTASPGVASIKDPYLNSVSSGVNNQGEPTLRVTLAGLKAAQDLVLTELKIANLEKKDPEGKEISAIKRRGEYIVLLYERALDLRLRDVYSQFLRTLISDLTVFKARVKIEEKPKRKVKIIFDSEKITERERDKQVNKAVDDRREAFKAPAGTARSKLYEEAWNFRQTYRPDGDYSSEDNSSVLVYYMRFGDILKAAMKNADLRDDISVILGNVKNKSGFTYSLYDLPVTMDTFGQYFYNRVVSNKLRSYPFRSFLDDMLSLVARAINLNPDVSERISFDYTVSSSATKPTGFGFRVGKGNLGKIGAGEMDPLASSGKKFQHYYNVFTRRTSHKNRNGKRSQDEMENIFHYVIGTDRGLAKNFSFSRQDTQYFQEMLIESNNAEDKIQALFLPQNVSIKMYGNTLHKNGDLIFVDSRPSLGTFAGPVLGIGGYYRVIRSSHVISNRGYETDLDCVFELRVVN